MKSIVKCILIFFAISISFSLYAQSYSSKDIEYRFDSITKELNTNSFSNISKAKSYLIELKKLTESSSYESIRFKAECFYWETVINTSQRKSDTSLIKNIKEYLDIIDKQQYPSERMFLSYALALSYNTKGDYAEAFSVGLHTLELSKAIGNNIFIAKTYILLGNICNYIKSYNMAYDYYQQAFAFVKSGEFEYYQLHLNFYRILSSKKQAASSIIDSMLTFFPELNKFGNRGLLAVYYLNLGACYSANGENEKALQCYNIAQTDILKTIDNESIAFALYQNFGTYYLKNKDFEKALHYLNKAKFTATQENSVEQLQYAYFGLYSLFDEQHNTDSAFFYLKKYFEISYEFINDNKIIEAYQAYASILLDASKKELIIAEQEMELKNRLFWVIITILAAAILLIILLLIVVLQKRRIKEVENRELSERLIQEQRIQQMQKEQLESKIREITSFSLLLSNKNNILQQISKALQPENKTSNFEQVRTNIIDLIKNNLHTDKDWETFMMHFDKVHPRFFEKLKEICSDLTEHNLKLCAYFRIGVSVKEISQILNITPDSVIVNRYRLKKKLGLKESDDLDDFIRSI